MDEISRLVIGFDFDMTLVDTSSGLMATLNELFPDSQQLKDSSLYPLWSSWSLNTILSHLSKTSQIKLYRQEFMKLYPIIATEHSALIPGAKEAIQATKDSGFTPVIISAKSQKNLDHMLSHFNFDVKQAIGDKHGIEKSAVIQELSCALYVGDQESDVEAAHAVDVPSLRITCQNFLGQTTSDWILEELVMFPQWLKFHSRNLGC